MSEPAEQLGPSVWECQPRDRGVLDDYQRTVFSQIVWDPNGTTIQGYPPEVYMYFGIKEESGETWGEDRLHPDYSRLRGLIETDGVALAGGPQPPAPELAIELHRKEFGDVSWYLANFLALNGAGLADTLDAGVLAWQEDVRAQPRSTPEFSEYIDRRVPWAKFVSYLGAPEKAAMEVMANPSAETIQKLQGVFGKFILSMALVTQTRLGTTYQAILSGNIAKVQRRIVDGTVFDKSGGDAR